MTFRRRIALLAGLSFVAAVIACSVVGYLTVRRQMVAQIDSDLLRRATDEPLALPELAGASEARRPGLALRARRGQPLPTDVLFQVVRADGTITTPPTQTDELPVDAADEAIATRPDGTTRLRTVSIDGERYRMVTASTGRQVAVQIARPLHEVEATLSRFALALVAVSISGTVLAAAVGWWVARRSARPVEQLTRAAEHVADTLEFDVPLAATHDDEIGQLTASISHMLAALKLSREQQQRLVVDASHELRTPLTSIRTNVDLLRRSDLDDATRAEIVSDIRTEVEELTELTAELVQLATDTRQVEQEVEVDMGALAQRVAERASKRTGQVVTVSGPGWLAWGRPTMLERAVQNLVDNACKWNPRGTPIEIVVTQGSLSVRDHGPGIPPAERERIFERFYRTDAARAMPGSGLGLAIVRQVIEAHDGTISVDDTVPGPGAVFTIRF
ncbi:sensor histidine kinase [Rhabdothermincola sediminis]|uniref:sensor histidine kinase n=1 Tax=Rhabdothermincola sediminis TaxID=2751370 RepID=UPI001AA06503|nr:HAMP domain-containing sensor histidine kinase [Rhabdothermincola sediminis]